jgi:hypothetical protein
MPIKSVTALLWPEDTSFRESLVGTGKKEILVGYVFPAVSCDSILKIVVQQYHSLSSINRRHDALI